MNPRVRTVVFRSLLKISGLSGEATLRCCVRCWGPFGLAQLLGGSGGRGATALPMVRGSASLPWVIRPARRADPTSWSRQARPLPWFRADGGYSVPLFAAQSRHEKPYPPMSKINFAFPFTVPFKGNGESIPHSSAQRKRGFWELKFSGASANRTETTKHPLKW